MHITGNPMRHVGVGAEGFEHFWVILQVSLQEIMYVGIHFAGSRKILPKNITEKYYRLRSVETVCGVLKNRLF